jgi:elongation factor P
MATTADFKIGSCLEMNNDLLMVTEFQRFQTGRGASNVRTKLKSLTTGKIFEHTFTGGEKVSLATIERRPHQYLYMEEAGYVFMNLQTFDQVTLATDLLEGKDFLKEGDHADIIFHADKEIALFGEMPQFVNLEVTYTEPGVKGDSANNTLKPAVLETGAEIKVPLFIEQGEMIRVDTRKREYYERVK